MGQVCCQLGPRSPHPCAGGDLGPEVGTLFFSAWSREVPDKRVPTPHLVFREAAPSCPPSQPRDPVPPRGTRAACRPRLAAGTSAAPPRGTGNPAGVWAGVIGLTSCSYAGWFGFFFFLYRSCGWGPKTSGHHRSQHFKMSLDWQCWAFCTCCHFLLFISFLFIYF